MVGATNITYCQLACLMGYPEKSRELYGPKAEAFSMWKLDNLNLHENNDQIRWIKLSYLAYRSTQETQKSIETILF